MGTAATFALIVAIPSAVAGAVLWTPRLVRALWGRLRPEEPALLPAGPPLEQITSDLRRLMAEHEAVRRSRSVAGRAARLAALEGAISDRARQAAAAVGLDPPPGGAPGSRAAYSRRELQALLRRLAEAGVVLPAERFGR